MCIRDREAAVVNNLKVYGAGNLKEVIEFFNDKQELELVHVDTRKEFYTCLLYTSKSCTKLG